MDEVNHLPEITEEKWSTPKFLIGIAKVLTSMATVSWVVYTILANLIIQRIFIATNGELLVYLTSPVMIILVSGWVTVSVIMGCNLQKAVSSMLENAKLELEFKSGFMKNIELKGDANAADMIKALKGL